MRNRYLFTVIVDCPDGNSYTTSIPIDEMVAPQFRRYDLCDGVQTARIFDGVAPEDAARIDSQREALATKISESLTEAILEIIGRRDLRNGYEQEKG